MCELPQNARVVIIGGGVIGLSIASHLTRLGECDVLVIEKERLLGSGSSAASAGGLRQQFAEDVNVLYAMEGVRQIRGLKEETGFDPEFKEHGYLLLAGTSKRCRELARQVEMQNRLGLQSEMLSPVETSRRFPVLRTDDLDGAAFCATDGYCDPHAILMACADRVRSSGGRIVTDVEVTGFAAEGPRVTGVHTTEGLVGAEFTVIAAGPHGRQVAQQADVALPLSPCRRQIFSTHPFDFPPDLPLVIDLDHPFYFRPESGGVILSAAEVEETRDFSVQLSEAGLPDLVERAVHRCPALASATISGGWAGIRTLTPDGLAILGDAPGRPGLLLAVGMSGHGITHAPAVGLALAERIAHGEARTLPLGPFRADRFAGPGVDPEGVIAG